MKNKLFYLFNDFMKKSNLYKLFSSILLFTCIGSIIFITTCDMTYIGERPFIEEPTYLTVYPLPPHITKESFANIYIHNSKGIIAECTKYEDIQIYLSSDGTFTTVDIPLVYYDPYRNIDPDEEIENPEIYNYLYKENIGKSFKGTGYFIVTFEVYGDIKTNVIFTVNNNITSLFIGGFSELNLNNNNSNSNNPNDTPTTGLGAFTGGLIDNFYYQKPIVAKDTFFEMNGSFYTLDEDTNINLPTNINQKSAIYYVYVEIAGQNLQFNASTTAPTFDSKKNGYYNNNNRCLFKFAYILDHSPGDDYFSFYSNYFFGKSKIHEHFSSVNLFFEPNYTAGTSINNLTPIHIFNGADNKGVQTFVLEPGIYIFDVQGAGGGTGGSGDRGGNGGRVTETVSIIEETRFWAYTGSKGADGIRYSVKIMDVNDYKGDSGGGGGSGSFIHTIGGSYLLCAGGGGGSNGNNADSGWSRGGGGAGGSLGNGGKGGDLTGGINKTTINGGAGGGAILNKDIEYNINDDFKYKLSSHFSNILSGFNATSSSFNNGSSAYYVDMSTYPQGTTKNLYTEKHANGQASGKATIAAERDGGNNRNLIRGEGGLNSSGHGFIRIYKL